MRSIPAVWVGLALALASCSSSSALPPGTGGATGGTGGAAGQPATGGQAGGAAGQPATGGQAGGTAGASAQGGSPGGAGGAAAGGQGGGVACGVSACAAGEVCVHPNCVPGALLCEPIPDGGQCPAGWTLTSSCPTRIGGGCTPGPCTPPAPFCAPVPASCNGKPTCTCLSPGLCSQGGGIGSCTWVNGSDVMCAAA